MRMFQKGATKICVVVVAGLLAACGDQGQSIGTQANSLAKAVVELPTSELAPLAARYGAEAEGVEQAKSELIACYQAAKQDLSESLEWEKTEELVMTVHAELAGQSFKTKTRAAAATREVIAELAQEKGSEFAQTAVSGMERWHRKAMPCVRDVTKSARASL